MRLQGVKENKKDFGRYGEHSSKEGSGDKILHLLNRFVKSVNWMKHI